MIMEYLLINHPARLPRLRPGRRVRPAGLQLRVRPGQPPVRRGAASSTRARTSPTTIQLNQDRCIMCTRCVRFTREITQTGELR